MDESCSYSKLKKEKSSSRGNVFPDLNINVSNLNILPPKDRHNFIFISFILGGAGFLFPYNSFIMAMDYFKMIYPGTPVVFDMSLVYIVTAFITVLFNNLLVETCSLTTRISFGYTMSFLTLFFVAVMEISWEVFSTATAYIVNLSAIALIAIGCTVQQSSFYGYTSMLPARYTQAVMVGESASGVYTSVIRMITKISIRDNRASTVIFFFLSIVSVLFCFAIFYTTHKHSFIQFYLALHESAKTKIVLEPAEDAGLIDNNTDLQYGMLKIQNSPPPSTRLGFNNPVYEPTGQAPTFKVEDIVIKGRTPSISGARMAGIKRGIHARIEITKAIYPYMISICIVYFETLCLYPGVASEIFSCKYGTWMPIIMVSIFNGSDLLGKMLTATAMNISRKKLVHFSVLRMVLVPLLITCAHMQSHPGFYVKDVFAFVVSFLLGISNGILGSVPMIKAPGEVDDCYREITGNLMTLLYNFGLISGSLTAYFIESNIPKYPPNYCENRMHSYPTQSIFNATTPLLSSTGLYDNESSTFSYTTEMANFTSL